jgi:hypothetical protein
MPARNPAPTSLEPRCKAQCPAIAPRRTPRRPSLPHSIASRLHLPSPITPNQHHQSRHTSPLNPIHPRNHRLRLQKINQQPPPKIRRHEPAKHLSLRVRPLPPPPQHPSQHRQKTKLIQLRRMPPHPIPKVDAPRQRRRLAIRIIRKPREETPQPSNRNPHTQRNSKQISSPRPHPRNLLHHLDSQPSTQQPTHNRLPTRPQHIAPMQSHQRRLLQQPQRASPHQRSHRRRSNHHPSPLIRQRIAPALAAPPVHRKPARIPHRLKQRMQRGMKYSWQGKASVTSLSTPPSPPQFRTSRANIEPPLQAPFETV